MKGFECSFCGKETDGCYVDRAMNFCNPSCAVKQAEQKDEGSRNIDQEVEDFVNSIKDLWKHEPLDGDETEAIANRILAELDNANGRE